MDQLKKPAPATSSDQEDVDTSRTDRRRLGRIVHDERGAARLEWQEIPIERSGQFKRLPLSIEGEGQGGSNDRATRGYDPYERVGRFGTTAEADKPRRRDLRRLGEWIKLTREMEERKAQGEAEDD